MMGLTEAHARAGVSAALWVRQHDTVHQFTQMPDNTGTP